MRFIPRNSVNLTFETVLRSIFDSSPKKIASGNYIREFERRFAEFAGVNYALGVYSARAGLHLILKCLGLNPGEEIILSAYNFAPVPILFKLMGYNPVFVDIKERTPNIDVDKIEEAIGPKSRVLFVTHMCGYPVNMDRILKIAEKYGLFVIEDCAHALGATYKGRMVGSFGAAGIFSFGYGKTMPCFGGGMITFGDENFYHKVKNLVSEKGRFALNKFIKTLFFYIFSHKYVFPWTVYPFMRINPLLGDKAIQEEESYSLGSYQRKYYGISSFQAKTGILQLDNVNSYVKRMKENAKVLTKLLKDNKKINMIEAERESEPSFLYYRIIVDDVKKYRDLLLGRGIDIKIDSMCTPAELRAYINTDKIFSNSEFFKSRNIELSTRPILDIRDMEYIVKAINEI